MRIVIKLPFLLTLLLSLSTLLLFFGSGNVEANKFSRQKTELHLPQSDEINYSRLHFSSNSENSKSSFSWSLATDCDGQSACAFFEFQCKKLKHPVQRKEKFSPATCGANCSPSIYTKEWGRWNIVAMINFGAVETHEKALRTFGEKLEKSSFCEGVVQ
jgi:hypothetical protein